jgi:hypothetical protein
MNDFPDPGLRDAYRALLERRRGSRRDCVSPEELLGVVDGTVTEAERLRTLKHVGSCARCREELEMLRLTAAVASRVARPQWRSRPLLAAAASIALVVAGAALLTRGATTSGDVERVGAAGAVALLEPAADLPVARPVTLLWAAVPEARRYDVEVLDRDGAPVYVTSTRDTLLTLPDSVPLAAGGDYRWWVRALTSDGNERASLIRRLRVATP